MVDYKSTSIKNGRQRTSLKWLTVAMPLLETRERHESDGAMAD